MSTHPEESQIVKHNISTVIITTEPDFYLTSDLDKEIGAPEVKTCLVLKGKKKFLEILVVCDSCNCLHLHFLCMKLE